MEGLRKASRGLREALSGGGLKSVLKETEGGNEGGPMGGV